MTTNKFPIPFNELLKLNELSKSKPIGVTGRDTGAEHGCHLCSFVGDCFRGLCYHYSRAHQDFYSHAKDLIRRVSRERRYRKLGSSLSCPKCGKPVLNEHGLKSHITRAHPGDTTIVIPHTKPTPLSTSYNYCPTCGTKIPQHLKTASKFCTSCGGKF